MGVVTPTAKQGHLAFNDTDVVFERSASRHAINIVRTPRRQESAQGTATAPPVQRGLDTSSNGRRSLLQPTVPDPDYISRFACSFTHPPLGPGG